jgi:hypothetical protein
MSAAEDTTRFPPRRIGTILRSRPFLTVLVVAWVDRRGAQPASPFGHLRYLIELGR